MEFIRSFKQALVYSDTPKRQKQDSSDQRAADDAGIARITAHRQTLQGMSDSTFRVVMDIAETQADRTTKKRVQEMPDHLEVAAQGAVLYESALFTSVSTHVQRNRVHHSHPASSPFNIGPLTILSDNPPFYTQALISNAISHRATVAETIHFSDDEGPTPAVDKGPSPAMGRHQKEADKPVAASWASVQRHVFMDDGDSDTCEGGFRIIDDFIGECDRLKQSLETCPSDIIREFGVYMFKSRRSNLFSKTFF